MHLNEFGRKEPEMAYTSIMLGQTSPKSLIDLKCNHNMKVFS